MRVAFRAGRQRLFLDAALRAIGAPSGVLAERLGVSPRTVRDWRRERWQMDNASLNRLCMLASLPRPQGIALLPEHWSVAKASRIGGRRHADLYGSPGTPAGRSLGGRNAQKRFGVSSTKVIDAHDRADGCVYHHRYTVNGKMYGYCKLCFTNYSRPLLSSAKRLFEGLRLFPTIHAYDGHRLYLHDARAVKRYFEIVGTHNPRYRERFDRFSQTERL